MNAVHGAFRNHHPRPVPRKRYFPIPAIASMLSLSLSLSLHPDVGSRTSCCWRHFHSAVQPPCSHRVHCGLFYRKFVGYSCSLCLPREWIHLAARTAPLESRTVPSLLGHHDALSYLTQLARNREHAKPCSPQPYQCVLDPSRPLVPCEAVIVSPCDAHCHTRPGPSHCPAILGPAVGVGCMNPTCEHFHA